MGSQLDKRMLHWQPAKCCIFQLFIIICYLANKVGLLLHPRLTTTCVAVQRQQSSLCKHSNRLQYYCSCSRKMSTLEQYSQLPKCGDLLFPLELKQKVPSCLRTFCTGIYRGPSVSCFIRFSTPVYLKVVKRSSLQAY